MFRRIIRECTVRGILHYRLYGVRIVWFRRLSFLVSWLAQKSFSLRSGCCSYFLSLVKMNSGVPFSAHSDVLDAPIPSDDAGKQRLFEECKRRATIALPNYPVAQKLYVKALECDPSSAICRANLSLVHGKMNEWELAMENAIKATELDESYVKGWWRLGQAQAALGKHTEAVQSLERAQSIDPANKALPKEIAKQQKLAKDPPKVTPSAKTTVEPARPKEPTKTVVAPKTTNTSSASSTVVDIDGTDFTKSDAVRGYKIVNGKKTSYFHNELSEDAKKLIGNIAPKRIEQQEEKPQEPDSTMGSAWNKAGTWEEKNVSEWACQTLQDALLQTTAGEVSCTKAEVTGHASVCTVRGKRRHLYEFDCCKLHWKYQEATGELNWPDIDGTSDEDDYEWSITKAEGVAKSVLEDIVRNVWRKQVFVSIKAWEEKFVKTHA